MKVLFIVGSCLRVNTSANLCHLAYISGCLDAGNDVDVISVSEKGAVVDESIKLPNISHWYLFDPPIHNNIPVTISQNDKKPENSKNYLLDTFKRFILLFYGVYGHTSSVWVNRAKKFKSNEKYDWVISLATPYVSHHLASILIKTGHVKCNKWIQIWEDPWSLDLYNTNKISQTRKEEERLLSQTDEIIYVSPLTLQYQQKLFPKYADKMTWHTLPYYYKNTENRKADNNGRVFGYYGDYFSFSRNLEPFYEAAKLRGIQVNIIGNSDLSLKGTDNIHIKARMGLAELAIVEKQTNILVFLCNIKGGQIPGKLYQYSATNKPILFILDGTSNEINVLRNYFRQFNRYVFCENTIDSISNAIQRLTNIDVCTDEAEINNNTVEQFNPTQTIKEILQMK